ncbi:hypothetical protein NEAUS04_2052 [Nematocida ausubeli]|nr:hypothetical protein NEAUS04_2052 [Nematocida ausubeli]
MGRTYTVNNEMNCYAQGSSVHKTENPAVYDYEAAQVFKEQPEHSELNDVRDKKYISGINLFITVVSSMVGAGVIFLYTAFANGGFLSFLCATLLSSVSILSVTQCVYHRYQSCISDERERGIVFSKQVTFIWMVNPSSEAIKHIITFLLFLKTTVPLVVYQSLIIKWLYSIIEVGMRLAGGSPGAELMCKIVVCGGIFFMFWKYLVQRAPGDSRVMQRVSVCACFSLLILLSIIVMLRILVISPPKDLEPITLLAFMVGRKFSLQEFIGSVSIASFGFNPQHNLPVYLVRTKLDSKTSMNIPIIRGIFLVYIVTGLIGILGCFLAYTNRFNQVGKNIFFIMEDIMNYTDPEANTNIGIYIELILVVFKLAISLILLCAFIWQSYSSRKLVVDTYLRLAYTPEGESKFDPFFYIRKIGQNRIIAKCASSFANACRWISSKIPQRVKKSLSTLIGLNTEKSSDLPELTREIYLRYIIGSAIFAGTAAIVLLDAQLTYIIQLFTSLVTSCISFLIPTILVIANKHITNKHGKSWYDYASIIIMGLGFTLLTGSGFAQLYYTLVPSTQDLSIPPQNVTGSV